MNVYVKTSSLIFAGEKDEVMPPADVAPGPDKAPEMAPRTTQTQNQGTQTGAETGKQGGQKTTSTTQQPGSPNKNKQMDGGSGTGFWIMLLLMGAFFYFVLIRPQKKREKERKEQIDTMKKGDAVTTIGGIKGVIQQVNADDVVIRTGDNTKVTFTKAAISRVGKKGEKENKEEKK